MSPRIYVVVDSATRKVVNTVVIDEDNNTWVAPSGCVAFPMVNQVEAGDTVAVDGTTTRVRVGRRHQGDQ